MNPLNSGISAYRAAALQQTTAPSRVAEQQAQAQPSSPAARAQQASALGADLSTDERAMIDRYFPPSAEMTLRLYGPGQKAQNLTPGAIGGRLDLKG